MEICGFQASNASQASRRKITLLSVSTNSHSPKGFSNAVSQPALDGACRNSRTCYNALANKHPAGDANVAHRLDLPVRPQRSHSLSTVVRTRRYHHPLPHPRSTAIRRISLDFCIDNSRRKQHLYRRHSCSDTTLRGQIFGACLVVERACQVSRPRHLGPKLPDLHCLVYSICSYQE